MYLRNCVELMTALGRCCLVCLVSFIEHCANGIPMVFIGCCCWRSRRIAEFRSYFKKTMVIIAQEMTWHIRKRKQLAPFPHGVCGCLSRGREFFPAGYGSAVPWPQLRPPAVNFYWLGTFLSRQWILFFFRFARKKILKSKRKFFLTIAVHFL